MKKLLTILLSLVFAISVIAAPTIINIGGKIISISPPSDLPILYSIPTNAIITVTVPGLTNYQVSYWYLITNIINSVNSNSSIALVPATNIYSGGTLPTGVLTAGGTNLVGHLLVVGNGVRYNTDNGGGLTNLSASSFASGNTSSSNNWVGTFSGLGPNLNVNSATNAINAEFATNSINAVNATNCSVFVVGGDSFNAWTNIQILTNTWVNFAFILPKMFNTTNFIDIAIPGETIATMNANYPTVEHVFATNGFPHVLCSDGGINDPGNGYTLAQMETNFLQYWAQAGIDGYYKICITPYAPGMSSLCFQYDQWITTQTNSVDVLVRWETSSNLSINYVSGHPDRGGMHIMASMICAAIACQLNAENQTAIIGGGLSIGNSLTVNQNISSYGGTQTFYGTPGYSILNMGQSGPSLNEIDDIVFWTPIASGGIACYNGSLGNAPAGSVMLLTAGQYNSGDGLPNGNTPSFYIDNNGNGTVSNNFTVGNNETVNQNLTVGSTETVNGQQLNINGSANQSILSMGATLGGSGADLIEFNNNFTLGPQIGSYQVSLGNAPAGSLGFWLPGNYQNQPSAWIDLASNLTSVANITTYKQFNGNGAGITNLPDSGIQDFRAGETNLTAATSVIVVFSSPLSQTTKTNYTVTLEPFLSGITSPEITVKTTNGFTATFSTFTGDLDYTETPWH